MKLAVDPSWRGFQFFGKGPDTGFGKRSLEFHAVLQQPCTLFMLHWFGNCSKM